ncbi:MAG: beta-ketoacyl-[acyl-carrier-protein] synthase family protein, partial [Rhodanobacter sp.]|nr:beta-ketoacyl-[acyl-carrier-protein] synthase family protein [Rhodanobacter sp.]
MSSVSLRRVVITGMGAISPLGVGAEALWQGLCEARSGIGPLRHPDAERLKVKIAAQVPASFDPATGINERTLPMLDRTSEFALHAAREAIAQSGLDFSQGELGLRTAVVVGTGVGGETTQDEQSRRLYADNANRVHPLSIVRLMTNASASQISIAWGLRGPTFAVASACASANHAIIQAAQMIRYGMADAAIAGGTEACITYGAMRAWEAMRVLAEDTCRPFSANRRGLVLGEGAGIFVLESLEHAQARGAVILAELAGTGMTADATDIVMPSAVGAAAAMSQALAEAGLAPQDVDYINAHGTGTQANDTSETRAIRLSFGAHADRLAVSSTKSMHGHALGASGALEL